MRIEFSVYGKPAQMGSKKAFYVPKLKRAIITDDNAAARKQWAGAVSQEAAAAMAGRDLLTGPVMLSVVFRFARPKSHYRSGKNSSELKPTAPTMHTQAPDCDKLVRNVGDALTGIVYRDDAQISHLWVRKEWTCQQAGAEIVVDAIGTRVS